MRTATFKAISGNHKILDLKVSANILGGGNDYIQKVNADGTWGQEYFYLTMSGTGYVPDGWYKDNYGGEVVTDADVLNDGEALFVTAAGDFSIVCAGKVLAEPTDINVPAGFGMVGNPLPKDVKISEIVVSEDVLGGGNDYAQKVNADGSWGEQYFYLTMSGTGYVPDGWYKDNYGGEAVTEADKLAAGESLFFTTAGEFKLYFPAAY